MGLKMQRKRNGIGAERSNLQFGPGASRDLGKDRGNTKIAFVTWDTFAGGVSVTSNGDGRSALYGVLSICCK